MKPRVLVGCPTHAVKDYAIKAYVEGIMKLSYPKFEVILVDNSDNNNYLKKIKKLGLKAVKGPIKGSVSQKIADSRNVLRKIVLDENYDYFLSLEQDIIPPKDIIERLLKLNKPIVSGVYYNMFQNNFGKSDIKPLAYAETTPEQFEILKADPKYENTDIRKKIESGKIKGPEDIHGQLSAKEVEGSKVIEVFYAGLGCMLIKREVLEKIEFRGPDTSFDDHAFCMDARKLGYKILLDTSVKCAHFVKIGDKKVMIQHAS